MSIKSKLLQEIKIKADKIKAKRIEAAGNKTLEAAVFDFFRNIEESRKLHAGKQYDPDLFISAQKSLLARIVGMVPGTKISVEFNPLPEQSHAPWYEQEVRGVTIWWHAAYIARNNVEPSLYIDVSEMLFI